MKDNKPAHPLAARNLKHHDFDKYPVAGHPLPSHGGSFVWDGTELSETKEPAPTAPTEWQRGEDVQEDAKPA